MKSKVRGLKRKTSSMVKNIVDHTSSFPKEGRPGCGYWHLHLPVAQSFIDSNKTPSSIRRLCMQTLINRVEYLISIKPESDICTRVVTSIDLPSLWDSQIIVFFGDEYFSGFFDRDSPHQKWNKLPQNRSLSKEFNLKIPNNLIEIGYSEHIKEDERESQTEIWFLGGIKIKRLTNRWCGTGKSCAFLNYRVSSNLVGVSNTVSYSFPAPQLSVKLHLRL